MSKYTKVKNLKGLSRYGYYAKRIRSQMRELEKKYPDSVALERYKGQFPTVPEIKEKGMTQKQVNLLMREAKRVLDKGLVSLRSVKRGMAQALETIHDMGITSINEQNFNKFFKWVDDMRAKDLGQLYSSTQMIKAVQNMYNKGFTDEQIQQNINNWAESNIKRDKEGRIDESHRPRLYSRKYGNEYFER